MSLAFEVNMKKLSVFGIALNIIALIVIQGFVIYNSFFLRNSGSNYVRNLDDAGVLMEENLFEFNPDFANGVRTKVGTYITQDYKSALPVFFMVWRLICVGNIFIFLIMRRKTCDK